MNSTLLKKYETIDQSKVSEKDKKVLEQVKKLTNGFEETDEAKNKVAEKILDQIATLNPDAVKKPQVVAQKVAKVQKVAKAKKVTKAKAPATTSTAKGSSNNIMSVAKEIQKAGESWKDAMERAKDVLKQRREEVVEQKKTELEKLLALVRTKKELIGFTKSDIQRDAVRTAKKTGARFVTKEGTTSNGYGTFPNKLGRKYWETRDRHADRLAPNYPKDMPLLAKGGGVDYYEQLAVYVQGEGSIYNGTSMKKAIDKANSYLKNNPKAEIAIVDEKYGDEYDLNGNLKEEYASGGGIDGGMFEAPIGMMKEVKGKMVNVPVTDEISQSEVNRFVDYVYEAYESYEQDGVYEFTKPQVRKAVNKYLAQLEFEHTWGGGDSLDRERVYQFLINPNLKEIKNPRFLDGGMNNLTMQNVSFANGGSVNMNKHIWEGWTVRSFIEELEPQFNQIMSGGSWQKPFKTKDEVKAWCMDNQPYYKKNIPEVVNYFWAKAQSKDDNGYYAKGGGVGQKKYNTQFNVGKAKYVVNYHDGVKKHKDGSNFYDIAIFKNKKDFEAFLTKLSNEGYREMGYNSSFANGGSIGDLTEQEFLKKYFGVNVFTENPSQFFEIKKMSSSNDNKVDAFVKELKADGFTVKKRAFSDFTSVMGVKKKRSFELGGAFVTTDLAGHTGGSDGLGNPTPLSGVSGTYYTGLVGETGAMSSGELFARGGAVGDNVLGLKKGDIYKIIDTFHTASYDTTMSVFTFIDYEDKYGEIVLKSIPFPPNPKKKNDFIYVSDVSSDGIKVLNDEEIGQVITRKYKNFVQKNYEFGGAMAQNQQVINDASQSYVNYYLGEGASQGIYKDGGSIPNNYEGRTAEDVWNNWTERQRFHFLSDHTEDLQSPLENLSQAKIIRKYDKYTSKKIQYSDLAEPFLSSLNYHIEKGQYASGGSLEKHYTLLGQVILITISMMKKK